MIAKVLIDNLSAEGLFGEWGLAIHIEYNGHKILLDTGTTGKFAENADAMGVNLAEVECGVLSHAHYDHANGMDAFFDRNQRAKFYVRKGSRENCYGKKEGRFHYNGIQKGLLKRHAGRIVYADGCMEMLPGAWLIPHSSDGLEAIALRSGLYVRRGLRMRPDSFAHEQSLVLETENGLVIFNSCSHAGPDNIVAEVSRAFPGKEICAYIGGLHLYRLTEDEVRALAGRIRSAGIRRVITGHCTGDAAFAVLKQELGDGVEQLRTGMEIEI